jgi:hypothetical protein
MWPSGTLELALDRIWGEENVGIFELAPTSAAAKRHRGLAPPPVSSEYRQAWEDKMPNISRRLFAAILALLVASSAGGRRSGTQGAVLRCDARGAAAARSGFRGIVQP